MPPPLLKGYNLGPKCQVECRTQQGLFTTDNVVSLTGQPPPEGTPRRLCHPTGWGMTGEAGYRSSPQPGVPGISAPDWRVHSRLQARGPGGRGFDATTASIVWLSVVSGAGGIRTLVPRLRRRAAFSEVVPVPPRNGLVERLAWILTYRTTGWHMPGVGFDVSHH